ncbi:hypothetical protein PF008_g3912 [Phytophthora fragariae]|uniref:peptidylprolyl isomerase n=1 Tax=Phytophthora fragariae TaxID=53985 RepID=A0A6G0SET5_9STRA|nr:hypothetical protein PF008_g3912 [Phytophthora fragariae]
MVRVYFDVSISGSPAGRITFRLYPGLPKTRENFRSLCTGERGLGRTTGQPLHYKKTPFHRIIKGFMLQSGDFSKRNGTGGECIYGGKFADESFRYRHSKAGLLSMANAGKDTNGSQFFITAKATPHLDGKHVVFGEVESGMDVVRRMESVETVAGDKPASMQTVVIEDCGEVDDSESDSSDDEEKKKRKALRKEKKKVKKIERKEKKRAKKEKKRVKKEAKREKRRRDEDSDEDKERKRHRRGARVNELATEYRHHVEEGVTANHLLREVGVPLVELHVIHTGEAPRVSAHVGRSTPQTVAHSPQYIISDASAQVGISGKPVRVPRNLYTTVVYY